MAGALLTAASFFLLGPIPGLRLPPANVYLLLFAVVLMGAGSCMVFVPALSAMIAVTTERFGKVEGLEDIVSGLLNSSYYFGGGLAPMIGGAVTESVGFALSSTYFGAAMVGHFALMLLCAGGWAVAPAAGVEASAVRSPGQQAESETVPIVGPMWSDAVQGKRKKPEVAMEGFLSSLVR